jgi:hypothetical protein
MSASTVIEWLFVAVFFLCFFLMSIGEILWLRRKVGVDLKRALIFVLSANFITITVGFFGSFVIFGVILAMAWDGSLEKMPAGNVGIWAVLAVAILFPIVLMMLWKRLLLKLLKFPVVLDNRAAVRPWRYSVGASILFFLVVIGVPAATFYLSSKIY